MLKMVGRSGFIGFNLLFSSATSVASRFISVNSFFIQQIITHLTKIKVKSTIEKTLNEDANLKRGYLCTEYVISCFITMNLRYA